MAQVLLKEVLPHFNADDLIDQFKESGGLKELLEATEVYTRKHYERADRNLKSVYYVNFVISQMTLQDDLDKLKQKDQESPIKAAEQTQKVRKRDRK